RECVYRLLHMLVSRLGSAMLAPHRAFTSRLPLRLTDVDPISGYIWFMNAVTGGRARPDLGICKESLEKRMLVQHFLQHYAMRMNSLLIWRMVHDWTKPDLSFGKSGFVS